MSSIGQKRVIKRLMKDLEELRENPISNISAEPLDENFLEWHCNFVHNGDVYHIILYFPECYPFKSPSAEFMPMGYQFTGGAASQGKKGTKVCLSIFSDFEYIHTEWADEKSVGWSPSYTVQTVLLNLLAFIIDNERDGSSNANVRLTKGFKCSDCGHSYAKPFPPLPEEASSKSASASRTVVVDYISKIKLNPKERPRNESELFGYGIIIEGQNRNIQLTSPCEYLLADSYYSMLKDTGSVTSMMKEKLQYFLPLFINPIHGQNLKPTFEKTVKALSTKLQMEDDIHKAIIKLLSNLMNSTVVQFSKSKVASEHHLNGYFALHRLLLWACDTYPKLRPMMEQRIENFIGKPDHRHKSMCPNIGEWLIMLAGSEKYRWGNVNTHVIEECWKRNVMWYLKDHSKLGDPSVDRDYRLSTTFQATQVSQKLIAFQVIFLDVAMPGNMPINNVIQRYDENNGFPSESMMKEIKARFKGLEEIKNYGDWFNVLNMKPPSKDTVFSLLKKSVKYAGETQGYYFNNSARRDQGRYNDRNRHQDRYNSGRYGGAGARRY
ncbi:unnamed protein product [Dimorphilus gyrociliatus]|uniref:UBC core domain-containing protein n=1 Tax=Dimorphilus gyrociliatus TaxID=2664684 RepID=A0A7I8V928_9ANNE|nr:unnamed protein product [Dimorphilus gyrociliatus]